MIPRTELRKIAKARLRDAEALFGTRRYDGAVYLCGYAVEIALKARVCRTLKWTGFPSTRNEFQSFKSLQTHDLDVLLSFTGRDKFTKTHLMTEWSAVSQWNPAARYQLTGTVTKIDAREMVAAAKKLLRRL